MSDKKIAVGDPVLFFGRDLLVTEIDESRNVAKCRITDELAWTSLVEKEREARGKPWRDMSTEDQAEYFAKVTAAQKAASDAIMTVALRADLLSWWEAKNCWVSEGRILTEEQIKECTARFGVKPKPSQHKTFYLMLEGEANG